MKTKMIHITRQWHTDSHPLITAGALFLAFALVGCGTTSSMKDTGGKRSVDLSGFQKVVVRDFVDAASPNLKSPEREKKEAQLRRVTKDFPDMLSWEIGQ